MKRLSFLLVVASIIAIVAVACGGKKDGVTLNEGVWRAVLKTQGQEIPFMMEVKKDSAGSGTYRAYILNGEERLLLDEVEVKNDSVIIPLHVFDASLMARLSDGKMVGEFVKHYESDYQIPFEAEHGLAFRFPERNEAAEFDYSGKYRVWFPGVSDTTEAVGVFTQNDSRITGTFLTPTGDYRFLEGNVFGDSLQLSTFDGNNLYLFRARGTADSLKGRFISGKAKNIPWWGVRDENAALPDAGSLTFLKEGYDRVEFSFPNVEGKQVSLDDPKYKGKVVILQLFGTWCPNCMDETKFLSPWYDENRNRGIEVIGLAFERKADFDYASGRVRRMIDKFDVNYDFVIAGTNDKESASAALPMLNKVFAFPTTIFIGRDGEVRKIHTGFSGPGTGKYYEEFVDEFNRTIDRLLAEKNETASAEL